MLFDFDLNVCNRSGSSGAITTPVNKRLDYLSADFNTNEAQSRLFLRHVECFGAKSSFPNVTCEFDYFSIAQSFNP